MDDLSTPTEATMHAARAPEGASGGGARTSPGSLAAVTASGEVASPVNLRDPELYLNRELTWLEFNARVLAMARDRRVPLLERVKFLAIVGATMDEFFMKRIGGLKQQVGAGVVARTVDGRTPAQQIADCYTVIRRSADEQAEILSNLARLLRKHGIQLVRHGDLTAGERSKVREHYVRNIFPLVTPQAIDPAHPFPFISNLSLNLLVTVRYSEDEHVSMARVKVPVGSGIPRFIQVANTQRYVRLEDVMAENLDLLFPGMEVESCETFRVTRNANTEKAEEEADDLLALIESELRQRKFAPIVRLQVLKGMNPVRRGMLAAELGLNETEDVFEVDGMMGLADLQEIAAIDNPNLHDSPHHPVDHPRLVDDRSIFHIVRGGGPLLLFHPYDSFASSVERFIAEAAEDPKVLAIKMTLYRTGRSSAIIGHLINAARNGKQVAVVVELKARFDEEANIRWANHLEEMGIHVTYGVVGLKTHCKTTLVVRRDYDGLRRYAHIATGNYHAGTARLYCDIGMLTCDPDIGADLTELFNYLTTGYTPARNYKKILPAPKILKRALLAKIDREIQHCENARGGHIQIKANALEDVDVTRALYRASQAGVKIDLVIRDTCRLRPGLPGVSENVRVISIVGRFLEHGRIYYFHNGGEEEYFIGSADVMSRNLKSRVEVVAPVEDPALCAQLRHMLDLQMNDARDAWDMQPDGTYVQRTPAQGERVKSSQQQLIELAEKRHRQATRLKRRKIKGVHRRNRS